MYFQEDWFMRQIESMSQFLAAVLFHKDMETLSLESHWEALTTQPALLHQNLMALVKEGKINEAENLLFDQLDETDLEYIKLGMDFYHRLNTLSEEELEQADFSREEIKSGLEDLSRAYGLSV